MSGVTDPSERAGNRYPLPRSRPSDHGVDARAIDGLLDDVAAHDLELHSLMVLRHGAVADSNLRFAAAARAEVEEFVPIS